MKPDDKRSEKEAQRIRDRALKRMLETPPKPHDGKKKPPKKEDGD
ncbi:hypothetical protein [Marinicauda salina]|nr:hypothetical protein [Marinicauda salina]